MIIINPQWQGIGTRNSVPQGAETIKTLLKDFQVHSIPLDDSDLKLENNVIGLSQITKLSQHVQDLLQREKPDITFTCGGDCSSDFSQLAYLNEKHDGDFTLIWIDAHADLNTPESSPSKNFHGMTLRTLMGDGPKELTDLVGKFMKPSQLVFSGLRSIDPEETRYLDEHNIPVFTTQETIDGALDDFQFPTKNLYIHVDIDSLDETVFDNCATPTSGGFQLEQLTKLIDGLMARYNVIGGCLTEYGPKETDVAKDTVRSILFDGFRLQDSVLGRNAAPTPA